MMIRHAAYVDAIMLPPVHAMLAAYYFYITIVA